MQAPIAVDATTDSLFIKLINDFQVNILKLKTGTGSISKGGTTHSRLGTY